MKFRLNESGEMSLIANDILQEMKQMSPISSAYIIDVPKIKDSFKNGNAFKKFAFAGVTVGSQGIFWKAFLIYIFPWMLDVAKVYCAIRIAQAFYQEKRGGRDDGTGFGSLVTYGKWYLVFWLIPWGVELVDQIGGTMFHDLQSKPLETLKVK